MLLRNTQLILHIFDARDGRDRVFRHSFCAAVTDATRQDDFAVNDLT